MNKTGIYHIEELNCVSVLTLHHLSANTTKSKCEN